MSEHLSAKCNAEVLTELREAYRIAIAARDFEINQLIQRNNFFMIFQGVLFSGLIIASAGERHIVPIVAFLVCFAGLSISVLQLLMSAGAKFWQERWEHAVEVAEREIIKYLDQVLNRDVFQVFSQPSGSINAIVEERMRHRGLFGRLVSARFSPSRVPMYVAFVFSVVWFVLFVFTFRIPTGRPEWIVGFN